MAGLPAQTIVDIDDDLGPDKAHGLAASLLGPNTARSNRSEIRCRRPSPNYLRPRDFRFDRTSSGTGSARQRPPRLPVRIGRPRPVGTDRRAGANLREQAQKCRAAEQSSSLN